MVATLRSATSTGTTTSASATSGTGQMSAQDQTDRFMKLLVAQLNNQDPMNPMDNAQMTSQIAQINTVSGIQDLNTTMTTMASMQALQGASLIGHDVLTTGNTLAVSGGVGKGAVDLSSDASSVTVTVQTPGGQTIDTLSLGAQSAGRVSFNWDASQYSGTGTPVFKVVASQGGSPVSATALGRDTVTSVNNDNGTVSLTLKSGAIVKYDAIKAVL